jgi:hypothetical protein
MARAFGTSVSSVVSRSSRCRDDVNLTGMMPRRSRGANPTLLLLAVLLVVCVNAVAGCNSGTRDPAGAGGTGGSGGAGDSGNAGACPGTLNGSCRPNGAARCNEHAGLPAADELRFASACQDDNLGIWMQASACDRSGAVGGCRYLDGTACMVRWEYEGTAADYLSDCADGGGTWITP